MIRKISLILIGIAAVATTAISIAKPGKKKPSVFSWVNIPEQLPGRCQHQVFRSASLDVDIGYCIYLPPGYGKKVNIKRRYPVVYHLHGGRPGSEAKSVKLARFVDIGIKGEKIKPVIYVFANGGPVSWYNMPGNKKAQGEDVFVKELIPHIDRAYRSDANRGGRAIEGFSQGGRGTSRIMFKYPELFCSAAPGGSGYGPEKKIQQSNGEESKALKFTPGDDAWSLAKKYANRKQRPVFPILIWCGDKGFNYETNLEYLEYLNNELKVEAGQLIAPGIAHSASQIYEKHGIKLMQFHQRNFSH
ncbi:MAG: 1,4-beta-xylanase [Verrucomicrobiaceae bacterium]|nr:1,4-beta-xylanase [Verrucomicrobiaceae bacterium]